MVFMCETVTLNSFLLSWSWPFEDRYCCTGEETIYVQVHFSERACRSTVGLQGSAGLIQGPAPRTQQPSATSMTTPALYFRALWVYCFLEKMAHPLKDERWLIEILGCVAQFERRSWFTMLQLQAAKTWTLSLWCPVMLIPKGNFCYKTPESLSRKGLDPDFPSQIIKSSYID